jgi:hypothetical protein
VFVDVVDGAVVVDSAVDGSWVFVDVGAPAGAVVVVPVVLVGSAGEVDPVDGSGALVDVGAPARAVLVVPVVIVGSVAAVDPVAGSGAVVDVGVLATVKTLFWACAVVDSGVADELGTGVALGGSATVKTVAHGLPATHVSPFAAASVVNFAPSGAVAATVTRNEVLALDPAVPTAVNAGTSQVTVLARWSRVSPRSANSPVVLETSA